MSAARRCEKEIVMLAGVPRARGGAPLNPIRVAQEYAMLGVLSGGRLIAGFNRG